MSQHRQLISKPLCYLTGEDASALGFNAHGGHGAISVTANVAPRLCAEFQAACQTGNYARALELQDILMPLHDALFIETSPAPVKYATARLGFGSAFCRLPLAPLGEAAKKAVDAAMAAAGVTAAKAAE